MSVMITTWELSYGDNIACWLTSAIVLPRLVMDFPHELISCPLHPV